MSAIEIKHTDNLVDFGDYKQVRRNVLTLVQKLRSMGKVDLSKYKFLDSHGHLRHAKRVQIGLHNEALMRQLLHNEYGLDVIPATAKQDMCDKVDFIIKEDDYELLVQYKGRNVGPKNDVGVEFCRVKNEPPHVARRTNKNRKGLRYEMGRDRSSIADVYLCNDTVNGIFHLVPNKTIDEAAKRLHDQFTVHVRESSATYTTWDGKTATNKGYEIEASHKTKNFRRVSSRNMCLRDDNIGEIRYFKPKPKYENEGIFKAILYLNSKFTKDYEIKLKP